APAAEAGVAARSRSTRSIARVLCHRLPRRPETYLTENPRLRPTGSVYRRLPRPAGIGLCPRSHGLTIGPLGRLRPAGRPLTPHGLPGDSGDDLLADGIVLLRGDAALLAHPPELLEHPRLRDPNRRQQPPAEGHEHHTEHDQHGDHEPQRQENLPQRRLPPPSSPRLSHHVRPHRANSTRFPRQTRSTPGSD